MRVRGIDVNHDWMFGKSKNDYKSLVNAVAQNIDTRLQSFLGDCFFALNDGIDWFNLLGSKQRLALNLAISSTILNTAEVSSIISVNSQLSENRVFSVQYSVVTVYGAIPNGQISFDIGV